MSRGGIEIEASLRMAGGAGEEVEAALAETDRLAGYRLREREPLVLEDVYLDTAEIVLGRAGLALRARRARGARWVAVKGDARRLPEGGARRLEVERRWSSEALARIACLLAERGIDRPDGGAWAEAIEDASRGVGGRDPGEAPPARAFGALGFSVVQRRRTRRRRSEILAEERSAGELALDRVRYRTRAGRGPSVVHREVEVEGLGDDAESVVAEVSRALRRRFGAALRPWPHDKLATGRALDRLAELDELYDLAGPDGVLGERAYARVDEILGEVDV